MSRFDGFSWLSFCQKYGVPYVERGRNVARDHVNIKCPFCGEADPSEHLGLSMTGTKWGCWRSAEHRGKNSPVRLIATLLGITEKEAFDIALSESQAPRIELHELKRLVGKLDGAPKRKKKRKVPDLKAPEKSYRIARNTADSMRALKYLKARGFTHRLKAFVKYYDPRFANEGPAKWRVTFPVYHGGRAQGYIGRAITESSLRYKAFPAGDWLRDYLWNYDKCMRATSKKASPPGRSLVICEGIFDASKIDHYGRLFGVRAVALLGLSLSDKKLNSLIHLARKYEKVWLCLDRGAEAQSLQLQSKLVLARARLLALPPGYKDAGEMDPVAATSFAKSAL